MVGINPEKYLLFINSIAFALFWFSADFCNCSADNAVLGLYNLCNSISWILLIIYPVFFLVIKHFSSQYLTASWIVLTGKTNFFDKSLIFISLSYLDKKNIYKYTFMKSPLASDKYSEKNISGNKVFENNDDKSAFSNFIVNSPFKKYETNYIIL